LKEVAFSRREVSPLLIMRPQSAPVVLLQFSVFLIGIIGSFTAAASSIRGNQKPPNYDQSDSKAPPYKSFDYSQGSDYYEVPEPEYQCYSCTYHVRQGTAAGQDNCRDPFVKSGISLMPCKGPCAKIYHKTSDTEYTLTRTCLLNCKDIKDEKGYTQCCFGNFCNGSPSNMMAGNLLLIFLGISIANMLS